MDDKSMAAQGAVPNQAAAEAQETLARQNHYAGGNALLDAQREAGTQIDDSVIEQPAATNIAGNQDTDDPTEAKFTTTGDYPVDFEQLNDEKDLSLTKDVPSAE
ncbi:MAG: hypothetical protein V7L29_11675 [Nostoc sp.]|uniref:hypothetical protein n=1 Tax=Nostoc sp. TaxID=1180 RepID=UPI002FF0A91C